MRKRLATVLVSGLVLGLLASCGEPEKLTAKNLFPRVSKAQTESGSSHIAMKLVTGQGQTFASHGQMKVGKRAEDTAMVMTVPGDSGGLGTIEMRLVGRKFYVALGALTQGKFAAIDLTDKSNPIAQQYGDIIKNVDPARQVELYRNAITNFDSSGDTVEIDGVQTQPYQISIDPRKAGSLKSFGQESLPKRVKFTLYVGPDDLPRRMVSRVPGANGTTRLQMDYTKWGEPVTIKAPSKAKIVDSDFFGNLGKAA